MSTLIERNDEGKPTLHLESWAELLNFIEQPLNADCLAAASSVHRYSTAEGAARFTKANSWSGRVDWQDVLRLTRDGYYDVEDQIAHASAPIIERITSLVERPDPYHDLVGRDIDIARYCEGEPECWIDMQRSVVASYGNRIVTVGINCMYSAGFDTDSIIARGATICSLIECMEMAGIRCEIICCFPFATGYSDSSSDIRIVLKNSDQPLDLGRLCFALCHPAFLRVLGFDLADHCDPAFQRELGGGYGNIVENPPSLKDEFDIWFDGMSLFNEIWHDKQKLEKYLITMLAQQGVQLDYDLDGPLEQRGIWETEHSNNSARERLIELERQRRARELEASLRHTREARISRRTGRKMSRRAIQEDL